MNERKHSKGVRAAAGAIDAALAEPCPGKLSERPPVEWAARAARRIIDNITSARAGGAGWGTPIELARIIEAEAPLRECEEALERIAKWDFNVLGDCVADAKALAESALKKLRGQP